LREYAKNETFLFKSVENAAILPEGENTGCFEFGTEELRVFLHDAKVPGSLEKNVET